MSKLEVVYKSVDELIPYANNSRTHSDEQVTQVAASIKEFGFTNPVLIDENNGIIAGHGRLLAAKKLKLEQVPTITLVGLTEAQRKAYVIADNKLALNAGWDADILKIEIEQIEALNFDIKLLGFDSGEMDDLFQDIAPIDSIGVADDTVLDYLNNETKSIRFTYCMDDYRFVFDELTRYQQAHNLENISEALKAVLHER